MSFRDQYYDAVGRFLVRENVVQEDELDFVEDVHETAGDEPEVEILYFLKDNPRRLIHEYGRDLESFLDELE